MGLFPVMTYTQSFLSSHEFRTWIESPLSSTEHNWTDKQLSKASGKKVRDLRREPNSCQTPTEVHCASRGHLIQL